MRVFGIDCGTECTGYGIVEWDDAGRNPQLCWLGAGGIRLVKKDTTSQRLAMVYAQLTALL